MCAYVPLAGEAGSEWDAISSPVLVRRLLWFAHVGAGYCVDGWLGDLLLQVMPLVADDPLWRVEVSYVASAGRLRACSHYIVPLRYLMAQPTSS